MSNYQLSALEKLDADINIRRGASADKSYVASLLCAPAEKVLKKVAEESAEFLMAAILLSNANGKQQKNEKESAGLKNNVIAEAADLQFHLQVALAHCNLTLADVASELARREGVSGLLEKANRVK